MDHYNEEQKALLDELSLKAEKLGYAVRYNPTDPARLRLISRHPSFLEEKDLWKQDFYDMRELADFLAAEASAPETRMCWRLQISIAPPDDRYESRQGQVESLKRQTVALIFGSTSSMC